jgi:hypothetical protein
MKKINHKLKKVLDVQKIGRENCLEDNFVTLLLKLFIKSIHGFIVRMRGFELGVLLQILNNTLNDAQSAAFVSERDHLRNITRICFSVISTLQMNREKVLNTTFIPSIIMLIIAERVAILLATFT